MARTIEEAAKGRRSGSGKTKREVSPSWIPGYRKETLTATNRQPCSICLETYQERVRRKGGDAPQSQLSTHLHHTNYDRDEGIPLCHDCHKRVHYDEGFYDELCPEGTMFW